VKRSGASRWGGVAHVFLSVALCLPLVAAGAIIGASMTVPDAGILNLSLLTLLAVVFLATVVWAALLPPVRQVEVSTARALLEYDEASLPNVPSPRNWASRRRGAAWLAILAGVGLIVVAAILYLVPLGIGLLAFPFSGDSTLRWPGLGTVIDTGAGWDAWWLLGVGALALTFTLLVVWVAVRLLVAVAPRVLGPTLTERVDVAIDRERALARANAVARDLHDQLGHTLTAMTVQATAARRLLATQPQASERALAAIEELGRRAQADVDGVVRALRDGAANDVSVSKAPATVDLAELARALVQESTLDLALLLPKALYVERRCAETARAVIREALTNATRHGTGSATLGLHAEDHAVCIEARNPMRRGGRNTPQRAGLAGLHERVLLVEGQITAGPEGGDSWLLTARLPIARPAPTT
jgi:signal transduction histidine kinase